MRPNRILHPELAQVIATLGHSDILLVVDAGFPIPRGAHRIDLGFYEGLPDLYDVLRVLRQEVWVEEVRFARDIVEFNPPLYAKLQEIFTGSGAVFKGATHEALKVEIAPEAKAIVRTGSFNPWGNIALVCSTDPFAWFQEGSGATPLPTYLERRRRIQANEVPKLEE